MTRWQRFLCNVMGWHRSPRLIGFDGCSLHGVCPRCGKRVLQDSQGNWFSSGVPQPTVGAKHE